MPQDAGEIFNPIISLLPEKDQNIGLFLSANLILLNKYRQNFVAATGLLDHSISLRSFRDSASSEYYVLKLWAGIAARDAIMMTYHFRCCLLSIKQAEIPLSWACRVDKARIDATWKEFEKAFQNIESIRNAVGHLTERHTSPDNHKRHSVDSLSQLGMTNGNTYTITNNGKHLAFDVTKERGDKLRGIVSEIYSAHGWLNGKLEI